MKRIREMKAWLAVILLTVEPTAVGEGVGACVHDMLLSQSFGNPVVVGGGVVSTTTTTTLVCPTINTEVGVAVGVAVGGVTSRGTTIPSSS